MNRRSFLSAFIAAPVVPVAGVVSAREADLEALRGIADLQRHILATLGRSMDAALYPQIIAARYPKATP